MRTIWQALAWKEWHEHKWKLVAVTAILTGVSAAVLFHEDSANFEGLTLMLVYGIAPIAIFLGAGEAAGERTRGTLNFTYSYPVPMWKVAVCKLALGLLTCILPILITLVLLACWHVYRSPYDETMVRSLRFAVKGFPNPAGFDHNLAIWTSGVGVSVCTVAASLFLWTVAISVNSKSEVRAGATSLLILVIWWSALAVGVDIASKHLPDSVAEWAGIFATGISPGLSLISIIIAFNATKPQTGQLVLAVVTGAVTYSLLAAWFICRFGLTKTGHAVTSTVAGVNDKEQDRLAPRRSAFTAILWKQFRESGPIVIAGLVAIACFFLGNLVIYPDWYSQHGTHRLANLLTSITISIGFLVALIVGISSFDQDLSASINEFWRSRPIHPDLWFWTKYLTGLFVVGAAIYLPLIVFYSWSSYRGDLQRPDLPDLKNEMIVCFHVAIYAAATATIVLIRQPIYAAILGVGALLLGVAIVSAIWGLRAVQIESIVYAIESTTAVIATLVAWVAVRYDWGHKA